MLGLVSARGPAPAVVNTKDGRGPAVVVAGDLRGGPSQLNSWSVGRTERRAPRRDAACGVFATVL